MFRKFLALFLVVSLSLLSLFTVVSAAGTTPASTASKTSSASADYASALKATYAASSISKGVQITLSEGGKLLTSYDSTTKINFKGGALTSTATVKNGNKSTAWQIDVKSGKMTLKSGKSTQSFTLAKTATKDMKTLDNTVSNSELSKNIEKIVEVVLKDTKSKATSKSLKNGGKSIVTTSGSAISVTNLQSVSKTVGTVLNSTTTTTDKMQKALTAITKAFQLNLPKPLSSLTIKLLIVDIKIAKEKYIEDQTVTIIFTGKDSKGKVREFALSASTNFYDYNKTVFKN